MNEPIKVWKSTIWTGRFEYDFVSDIDGKRFGGANLSFEELVESMRNHFNQTKARNE